MLIKVLIEVSTPVMARCHVCLKPGWVLDVVMIKTGKSRDHALVCYDCFHKGVEITREGVKSLES